MKTEKLPIKILSKHYEPETLVDMEYKGLDMTFKTDNEGNPVLLFIGKRQENGVIYGERYVRTLIKDKNGGNLKDHWEHKGKAS
jgi:hypothetical protein